jgi:Cysteine-rich CWC
MAKEKICGACGEKFVCAAPERGCWCESLEVPARLLDALRARYDDCLCGKCLNELGGSRAAV